jgi:hypothetical protein
VNPPDLRCPVFQPGDLKRRFGRVHRDHRTAAPWKPRYGSAPRSCGPPRATSYDARAPRPGTCSNWPRSG